MLPDVGDYIYVPYMKYQYKRRVVRIFEDGTIVGEYRGHKSTIRPGDPWRPAPKNGPQTIKSLVGFSKEGSRMECIRCDGTGRKEHRKAEGGDPNGEVHTFISHCGECGGDGLYHGADAKRIIRCGKCSGTGQHRVYDSKHIVSCNKCDGVGELGDSSKIPTG